MTFAEQQSATLVSLCEFRQRTAEAVIHAPDDAYEPIAGVVREVGRAMMADGVLVTWHAEDSPPTFLFASGACEPRSDVEQDMVEAACAAAADPIGDPVQWSPPRADANGTTALLTTRIVTSGGAVTLTTFFRRMGSSARSGARDVATRMLPIVQGFFRLWSMRAGMLATNRSLTAALNTSATATLIVDASGRLLFANDVAERLLASDDGVRRAGAMLSGTRLADTMRLHASIAHVALDTEGGSAHPVLALQRRNGRPLLAAVVPAHTIDGASRDAAAIVHLFDPDHDLEPLLAPVCRLYGLSPVEARLTSLLARGVTIGDAARTMRVQEQTARSYLKHIFLKTDTNRQAQLVWLMLKSAVLTAPGCVTQFM